VSKRPSGNRLDGRVDGSGLRGGAPRRLDELEIENAQLRVALDSRIVIEQAKGMLAERFGLELHDAFLLLRRAARTSRRGLHTVATAVIGSPDTPREVAAVMDGDGRADG
jgi:ANTAR domain